MNSTPCAPNEVHPAYEWRHAWLAGWLNTPNHPYGRYLRIPIPSPIRLNDPGELDPDCDVLRTHTLTKRKALGRAPYVGRAFVYLWYIGEDELGRMVAGDARIEYIESEWEAYLRARGRWDQ